LLEKDFNILVDPITNEKLELIIEKENECHVQKGKLSSKNSKYEINDNIIDLLPKLNSVQIEPELIEAWKKLQNNGSSVYEKFPSLNLSVKNRKVTKLFQNFCNFSGKVLDVGSGPIIPYYLLNNNKIDLGFCMDPLIHYSNQPIPNLQMIKGIGEYLPFENDSLDMVSFATSFDHVMKPKKVLNEVKRVLKNKGVLIMWMDNDAQIQTVKMDLVSRLKRRSIKITENMKLKFSKNYIKYTEMCTQQSNFVKSLPIPTNADDAFHFKHISFSDVDKLCSELKFNQITKKTILDNTGMFVKYDVDKTI